MNDVLLRATDLRIESGAGPIVVGMDLTVPRGGTVAIVGESGSGKSMVAKAVTGLLPPGVRARGTVEVDGSAVDLAGSERSWRRVRGRSVVLLLQDPFTSLSPVHRCGRQIAAALPGARRLSRAARADQVGARLVEVGLSPDVARLYPFELSGGMRQRVAIAAALAAGPELLIADEPTTALDVTTQRDILDLLAELQRARRMGLVLITHDLELAKERAHEIVVMYAGRVLESGPAAEVFARPAHPYTIALHDANPPLEVRLDRLPAIEGAVPRPSSVTGTCPFAARCARVHEACTAGEPPFLVVGGSPQADVGAPGVRHSACLLAGELLAAAPAPATTRTAREPGTAAPHDTNLGVGPERIVIARDLRKTFAGGRAPALDGVDLEIVSGEAVGIVGESGSGKTTLARCIVGLETADTGDVRFFGPLRATDGTVGRPVRTSVQIVFQDPYSALNPSLTVGTTLREALRAAGRSADEVGGLLTMVGLPQHYARRRPRALSGGERQRVAIARALAPRPTLLVCDESVSALDVSVQAQILNLLADLREQLGLSLLFISHDLAVVRQVADRVYVMHNGRVVEEGEADQVLARPEHEYTRTLMASVPGQSRTGAA